MHVSTPQNKHPMKGKRTGKFPSMIHQLPKSRLMSINRPLVFFGRLPSTLHYTRQIKITQISVCVCACVCVCVCVCVHIHSHTPGMSMISTCVRPSLKQVSPDLTCLISACLRLISWRTTCAQGRGGRGGEGTGWRRERRGEDGGEGSRWKGRKGKGKRGGGGEGITPNTIRISG